MVQFGQMENYYFSEATQALIGQMVAVQMTSNHVKQGTLKGILPDHLLLDVCTVPFFIRLEEVQWITPVRPRN